MQFFVNCEFREFGGPDAVPLLWVVRENFGLTGTTRTEDAGKDQRDVREAGGQDP